MKKITIFRPYRKVLFPVPARITFAERIKKNFIFHFIEFDVFGITLRPLQFNLQWAQHHFAASYFPL